MPTNVKTKTKRNPAPLHTEAAAKKARRRQNPRRKKKSSSQSSLFSGA